MFDVSDWLDRAKARNGLTSDYKLALVLGVSHSSLVNYRKGKTAPDERITLRLCELSGDDPEHVAACLQSMRAANDDAADLWRRVAARLKQTGNASAIFLGVLAALLVASFSDAVQAAPDTLASQGLAVMSN